jgi:ferredoxin
MEVALKMIKQKAIVLLFIMFISSSIFAMKIEKFKINPLKCIGCGLCVEVLDCPTGAISIVDGKAYIDPEKCIDCGFCKYGDQDYIGCPANAIFSWLLDVDDLVVQVELDSLESLTAINVTKQEPTLKPIKQKSVIIKEKVVEEIMETKQDTLDGKELIETPKIVLEKKKYFVDPKVCISCRLCLRACKNGAISMVKGKAYIDPEKCQSCGSCYEGDLTVNYKGCPVSAIKIDGE